LIEIKNNKNLTFFSATS